MDLPLLGCGLPSNDADGMRSSEPDWRKYTLSCPIDPVPPQVLEMADEVFAEAAQAEDENKKKDNR